MKVGSKVRLIGVRVDDKGTEAKGTILQIDMDGIAIVELKDRVLAILPSQLVLL